MSDKSSAAEGAIALITGGEPVYSVEICETILQAGRSGAGREEIVAALGVEEKHLRAWERKHGELRQAFRQAKRLEYAWWLAAGRELQARPSWNARSWELQMAKRFPKRWANATKAVAMEADPEEAEKLRASILEKLNRIAEASRELD